MSDADSTQLANARSKNGHKLDCDCHICQNMRNKAKRGGYKEDAEKKLSGGSKKKNGHKDDCMCPICKNMKNAKSSKKDVSEPSKVTTSPKKKSNGHKVDCKCPICNNMRKTKKGGDEAKPTDVDAVSKDVHAGSNANAVSNYESNVPGPKVVEASDSEYDELARARPMNSVGGSRKRRSARKIRRGRTRRMRRNNRK